MKDKRYNKVITLMQEKKLENMNNNIFLNKGITLISLVITIIILILLAGIVINISLGQNGIFTRTKQAKKQMEIAKYIDKVELSRAQAIIQKTDTITLDDLIKQIYIDKIVVQGSIAKLEDNKSAKMVTKEGYIFIVTQNSIEYIGSSIEEATVKEAKLESSTKDGIVTLTINAGMPGELIENIELYEESQGKIENILIPTGMSKIQKEKLIQLPFYEEKDRKYYIKVIGSITTIESEKVTVEKNTNTIRTAKDLKKFATLVNSGEKFEGKTINQLENIDLGVVCSSTLGSWEPIGYNEAYNEENVLYYFNGTYNGNSKKINNIYINESDRFIQRALFGILGYNGKVENLTVQGTITTQQWDMAVAGIVGRNEGTIENCINNVEVNGINTIVGGIVGNNLGIIKNCMNKTNVYGGYVTAGISANNLGEMENDKFITANIENNIRNTEIVNCTNEGTIIGNGYVTGGIVGNNSRKIENCKNEGNVTSKAQVETKSIGTGGIVGDTTTNITNCSNKGNIKTNWNWAGGIAGHVGENVKIEKCYNYDATIETVSYAAGGIVGRIESGSIENCYNILLENSYIKAGEDNAGGIVGTCVVNLLVKNCYNIGNNIQAALCKGLILGVPQNNETSIENCYYEKGNSLGIVYLNGCTLKLNTAIEKENSDFKLNSQNQNSVVYGLNNYIGSEIWEQDLKLNNGYPYLKENK